MIAYVLIVFGFLMRFIPHVPNFVPVAAIALFAGAYLDRRVVPWVPLAIMAASDFFIGLHNTIIFTWGSFILIGFLGVWLKKRRTAGNILAASLFSAVMFFVISNFGVWAASGLYAHTWAGFSACYVNAVPFFRNTLAGNLAFTLILFGAYEIARKFAEGTRLQTVLLAD